MGPLVLELLPSARTAFTEFVDDESQFALVLCLEEGCSIRNLPPLFRQNGSFQSSLSQLEGTLTSVNSAYIILRQDDTLILVTYVPYRASEDERAWFLENRHVCVRNLGEECFVTSIICKEMGEITDIRSWEERDAEQKSEQDVIDDASNYGTNDITGNVQDSPLDAGYKKNKCRLCDRRMKNKMSPEASEALRQLHIPGTAVQVYIKPSTETLEMNFVARDLAVADVAATLPNDTPSFTFYRHPTTEVLYFIFHSPDNASVQERMMHTVGIPGLINIHAKEQGVHVDQKIEIHDPDDLVFETKDERIGKFRSMYLRNRFDGTESRYDGLEADKVFYDAVR